jgi:6-phosphofructokinase 1
LSPRHNDGQSINVINQRLSYLVRSGRPDFLDSIVPIIFGNLALDLIEARNCGRLVSLRHGQYGDVPLDLVISSKKVVDVEKYYHTERYRPLYKGFSAAPMMIMTSDI